MNYYLKTDEPLRTEKISDQDTKGIIDDLKRMLRDQTQLDKKWYDDVEFINSVIYFLELDQYLSHKQIKRLEYLYAERYKERLESGHL